MKKLIYKTNGKSVSLFRVTYKGRIAPIPKRQFVLLATSGINAISKCNKLIDREYLQLESIENISKLTDNDFIINPQSIFPID